ncbi:MAG: hypothetical protein K2K46_01755 [Lachnospiraceae bacterium]|nr:hypothetical protein [Lachnospiraceae bacterium]
MLRKNTDNKKILYDKYLRILCLSLIGILSGCATANPSNELLKDEPLPELCEQELRNCFGENYLISEGEDKEGQFLDKDGKVQTFSYTEWELTYQDADEQERVFVINTIGGGQPSERIEKSIESYFSDLVEAHYKQKFWNKMVAKMPGCREDSVLYFKEYRLFSNPDIPETSVMFDERLHYSLIDNVYFPQLKYTDVCIDFPYIFNLYLYVDYVSNDKAERMSQRRDTEKRLRETMDAMIQYTGESLNAKASVTMMDENGAADIFSIAVLKGDYFDDGYGIEYEKELHENFFGLIENRY